MWTIQTALLLVGILAYIDAQDIIYTVGDNTVTALAGWKPYDCRRGGGVRCNGNGICTSGSTGGSCLCSAGYDGYDCSIFVGPTPGVQPVACGSVPCVRGNCYRDNTLTVVCLCNPVFTGVDCDISRVSVLCRTDDMVARIYPQPPSNLFQGRYAVQQDASSLLSTSASCSGDTTDFQSWLNNEYFDTTFDLRAAGHDCAPFLQENDVPGSSGAIQSCYDVRLQYSSILSLPTDEVFTFCCGDDTNTGGNVNVDDSAAGGGADVNGSATIIQGTLVRRADNAVITPGSTVNFGQELSFVLTLDNSASKYTGFRVVTCTATPGPLRLVNNQCPDPDNLSVIDGIRQVGLDIHVDITAYKGTSSSLVTLECDSMVCTTANPCPAITPCPGSNTVNLGRKKRQVDLSTAAPAEMFTASTAFVVLDIGTSRTTTPVSEQPCYQSTIFIAIVTVFGVLILVALVVSVVVCMRYAAHGRRSKSEPAAYFNAGMAKA